MLVSDGIMSLLAVGGRGMVYYSDILASTDEDVEVQEPTVDLIM